MKIAVNAKALVKGNSDGVSRFTHETFSRIVKAHPEHQFYFIFDKVYQPHHIYGENVVPIIVSPPASNPLMWWYWHEVLLADQLKKIKPDVFVAPDGFLSLSVPTAQVAVIHDLSFEHYPELETWARRKYFHHFFPKFAERANRILTVSNFSKSDICGSYRISPHKIDVAYNAADPMFAPLTQREIDDLRFELTDGCPYFIYIGSIHPRKNVGRMLRAFDRFKDEIPSNYKLLMVGKPDFKSPKAEKIFREMHHKSDVIFSGWLSNKHLAKAVGAAEALIFVPIFEGFGIPLVEAMKANVPIITSSVTSLPEVAGDAALLVDPFSITAIKNAMVKMANDYSYRNEMAAKSFERGKLFNWDNTASILWSTIQKAVE